jgi:hypothetical protein
LAGKRLFWHKIAEFDSQKKNNFDTYIMAVSEIPAKIYAVFIDFGVFLREKTVSGPVFTYKNRRKRGGWRIFKSAINSHSHTPNLVPK